MASPVVASSATVVSTGGGAVTCTKPSGTADGDLLLAFVGTLTATLTPPSGWTQEAYVTQGSGVHSFLYSKVASSEPANYTWTPSANDIVVATLRVTGYRTAGPIDVSATFDDSTSDLNAIAPSVTTTVADTLLLTAHTIVAGAAKTFTPPAGMTEVADIASVTSPVSSIVSMEVNRLAVAATGATGTKTATMSATPNRPSLGLSVAIAPAAVATALAVTTQPSGAIDGVAFSTQPVVRVVDQYGDDYAVAGTSVTVTKNSGTGVLGGTTSASTDANGDATFTDLAITGSGAHTLAFAATGLTGVNSGSFSVAARAATALAITTQPSGAVSGVAFTTQPVVRVVDQVGDDFAGAGTTITAAKASGSGTLGGTTGVNTDANGDATFTDLAITGSGAHTLSFSATGLTGVTSASLTVTGGGGAGSTRAARRRRILMALPALGR